MSAACPKHDTGGGPCYCPGSACRPCITHHHACDCREHKVAVLIKASLDAAVELDELKNTALNSEEINRAEPIVARLYSACEALGVDLGKHEVAA